MNRRLLFAALSVTAALLGACAPTATSAPAAQATTVPVSTEAAVRAAAQNFPGLANLAVTTAEGGAVTATGTLDGTSFAIRFPANWNRSAVLYAHGYVQPGPNAAEANASTILQGAPLALPFSQGYAIAASSYEKVGYAVGSGVARTQRLREFLGKVGLNRAYVAGVSMGGNVVMGLIEKAPNDYQGALAACGVMAGWAEEVRYLVDARLVYDFFTKGTPYALPGADAPLTPNAEYAQQFQPKVVALFTAAAQNRTGPEARIVGAVASVAGVNPDPTSFATALGSSVYGTLDLVATAGGNPYGNAGKVYGSPLLDAPTAAALNAGVTRLAANDAASAYLAANYTPTGRFSAKLFSFHNTIDPLVPYQHQALLKATVTAAGNTANLVQQKVTTPPASLQPRHCDFTPAQFTSAWTQLRGWVENGVRPQDGAELSGQ